MASDLERTDPAVQDLDLFGRLTQYFEHLDQNLRGGIGWLVFNASGARGRRISGLMIEHFRQTEIPLSMQHVPWRDFSLNAYMVQVELQAIEESGQELAGHAKEEFDIATRVSRDNLVKMVAADVLILSGVTPKHRHEVDLLSQTIERRHNLRVPTVFITPSKPHELAIEITRIAPGETLWDAMFDRMYRRCLVAM
jgi:hypothetical protein